ncbi:MAG: hypothetical protein EA353_08100 [Puniceicoccaceae bacterium]|nr:MAG: hypothetical protein EA353_08100 [Puniceicoccaceae bacterium]
MPDIILVLPGQSATLPPSSPAFAHGFGLFETMHYAGGQLYFWSDHWARLSRSAGVFGLAVPPEDAVLGALRDLVAEADLSEGVLKLSLLKLAPGDGSDSQLYVYTRPSLTTHGTGRLWLDRAAPIFERSPLAGHKTHNYMETMHRLQLARAQGYDDALRLDSVGHLAETTTANLFFVKTGHLCTPALETGILPGVTRAALLRSRELAIETGSYPPEVLLEAEAVFISNAPRGLQAIGHIEGLPGPGCVGYSRTHPLLEAAQSAYARLRAENAWSLR